MCFSCVGMGLSMAAGYTALAGSGSQSHVWFHKNPHKTETESKRKWGARSYCYFTLIYLGPSWTHG